MSFGTRAKNWGKKVFVRSRVLPLASQFTPLGAVILAYHSIQDHPEHYANSIGLGIIHSTSVFEKQMELIVRRFNPVTLEDILLFLKGEKRLPRRSVAVTFDDGYADNFQIAEPILRRFGVPAAFYVTVDFIETGNAPWFCRLRHAFAITKRKNWEDSAQGRLWRLSGPHERNAALQRAFDLCSPMTGDIQQETINAIEQALDIEPLPSQNSLMMSWDQVRRLSGAGHIIGSHTLTHPNLAYVGDEDTVREELVESKCRLEKELGLGIGHFSYPHPALNPQWTNRTLALSEEGRYKTAITTSHGPVRAGANPLLLKRMVVPRQEENFLWNLERTFLIWRV